MKTNNLRFALRSETQEAHQHLDMALIKHDLTALSGLSAYLNVHYLARIHLQKSLFGYDFLRDDDEKLAHLRTDFKILGVTPPVWNRPPEIGEHHPLGLIYVMAGSALGSKLLYKNWSAASDINILKVKNFMTCAKDSRVWTDFLSHINTMQFGQTETDKIIDAANYCFGVFTSANKHISEGL